MGWDLYSSPDFVPATPLDNKSGLEFTKFSSICRISFVKVTNKLKKNLIKFVNFISGETDAKH